MVVSVLNFASDLKCCDGLTLHCQQAAEILPFESTLEIGFLNLIMLPSWLRDLHAQISVVPSQDLQKGRFTVNSSRLSTVA